MATKPANKELVDILESDDELPYDYNETADLPAYKKDDRFDPVVDFMNPWMDDDNSSEHDESNDSEKINQDNKIKKGVLSKQDIFCLQCIGQEFSDSTLIWFINFLMSKDLQSNYRFLKSCLVADIFCDATLHKCVSESDKKCYFNIVVKT